MPVNSSTSMHVKQRYKIKQYDKKYKKLSYRRVTARFVLSVVILPIAAQQCRNYLYDLYLHTLSRSNIMFKYADDTNLLVPAYSDVSLLSEFEHVKQWAADNKMIINISKTKELVFQRPSLKHFLAPSAVCGIEQVPSAKLLGVIFKNNLNFDEHVTAVL